MRESSLLRAIAGEQLHACNLVAPAHERMRSLFEASQAVLSTWCGHFFTSKTLKNAEECMEIIYQGEKNAP